MVTLYEFVPQLKRCKCRFRQVPIAGGNGSENTFKLKPVKKKKNTHTHTRLNLILNDGPLQELFDSKSFQWLASPAFTRF